jgi:hypothetical protein
VRDPKALNPLAQALLDRALRDREIGPVPEEAAKLVAKIMAPPEELRTRWTVSVPGYTLPTEVMAFPTAVNAEAAIKAYCDRLGVSRLPTNPRVESAE